MITVTIIQEFIPNRLLEETKQIIPILAHFLKSSKYTYQFTNTIIQIQFLDIAEDYSNYQSIKDVIISNKIKFSKSINKWPRPILEIDVCNGNSKQIIQIDNKIAYKLDIPTISDINPKILDHVLKELCIQNINNEYVIYGNQLYDNGKIFLSIVRKTVEDKISDIRFFINLDKQINNFDVQLNQIEYFTNAGTMLDKIHRLTCIASQFYSKNVIHAAQYSKYDLCTHMVYEYAELQGIIGAIYFDNPIIAAQYIHDINQFNSVEDMQLALIENLDKLCIYISAGASFSTSRDPFGLRRSLNIIIDLVIKLREMRIEQIVQYICKLINQNADTIISLLLKRCRVIYKQNIITHNLTESIQNILFFEQNRYAISSLKQIYKRLAPMVNERISLLTNIDSISELEAEIILLTKENILFLTTTLVYKWIDNNYITDSDYKKQIAGFILYHIEKVIHIHLAS